MKDLTKTFSPDESVINTLDQNQTSICWMDDRGVNQPFYVTDYGKTKGFQVKPTFLDDRVKTDFPEEKIANILREAEVNTPEVTFMQYDDVIKLMPPNIIDEFTKYIKVEDPYYSKIWLQRWKRDRQSAWYIVQGYLNARDMGNPQLLKEMSIYPENYHDAVNDLAKVWLYEKIYYLGDRKPGHYMITAEGNGFGVDYQFYQDKGRWEKSMHFLPLILESVNHGLRKYFNECVLMNVQEMKENHTEKSFKMATPDDWDRMDTITEVEKHLAAIFQKKIYIWYKKAVHTARGRTNTVAKSAKFEPTESYLTNGDYVWQNGMKYPSSVLGDKNPTAEDLKISPSDYKASYDMGVMQAQLSINSSPLKPEDMVAEAPQVFAPTFEDRINFLADQMSDTMKDNMDNVIVGGLDSGMTYGEIGDAIQQTLGVNPDFPDMPGWRAERIARTESMWAVNQGLLDQFKQVGINQVNIVCAADACDDCVDLTGGNPYTLAEAEDLIPYHPNCRCDWVGDYSQWLG
jgi:hypothetical protein